MDHEQTKTGPHGISLPPDYGGKNHGHWAEYVWRLANICFPAMAWASLLAIVWAIVPNLYTDPDKLAFIESWITVLCVVVLVAAWCGVLAEYMKAKASLANLQSKGRILLYLEHFLPVPYAIIAILLVCVLGLLIVFVRLDASELTGSIKEAATGDTALHLTNEVGHPPSEIEIPCCCGPRTQKRSEGDPMHETQGSLTAFGVCQESALQEEKASR